MGWQPVSLIVMRSRAPLGGARLLAFLTPSRSCHHIDLALKELLRQLLLKMIE